MRKKNFFSSICMLLVLLFLCSSSVFAASNQVDVYRPDPNVGFDANDTGVNYPRTIQLNHSGTANGTLLTTFEQSPGSVDVQGTFPIYRSTDDGKTWAKYSDIVDTQNNWGMVWEPQLYELPAAVGNVPAGTILASGMSIKLTALPDGTLTYANGRMELYRSDDHGLTWSFMTTIAVGGDHTHPIWEPYLALDSTGRLVVYYSDEREHETHSQKLVHQVSTDGGYTWGPVVNDVRVSNAALRPGMPVVSKLGNGQYFMTYEVVGLTGNPVHFRYSSDGVNWGDPLNIGTPISTANGTFPGSTPFNVWTPNGGPNGTIYVSSKFTNNPSSPRGGDFFVNYNYGQGTWYKVQQPNAYANTTGSGYSSSMVLSPDGQSMYHTVPIPYPGHENRSIIVSEKFPLNVAVGNAYKIVNKNSAKPIAINASSTSDGALAIQYSDTYGAEQQWYLVNAGNGNYAIVNLNSNKALSMPGASTSDGSVAVQWPYYMGNEQLWTLELQSDGFYKIRNTNSGKLLDVAGGSTANGAAIEQRSDNSQPYQEWQFQFTDVLPSNTIINKIQNPSFEADQAWTASPTSWTTWTNNNAAFVETTGGAHTGNWHGTHWKNAPYQAYTSQTFTGLANGTYTLRAYVKGSGGQNQAWMSAKNFGSAELTANIPASSYYTQITIPNINVTNGQCTVGFWSDASANQWINFDDVEFFKN